MLASIVRPQLVRPRLAFDAIARQTMKHRCPVEPPNWSRTAIDRLPLAQLSIGCTWIIARRGSALARRRRKNRKASAPAWTTAGAGCGGSLAAEAVFFGGEAAVLRVKRALRSTFRADPTLFMKQPHPLADSAALGISFPPPYGSSLAAFQLSPLNDTVG